jgi:asparagine synthase (glutamine-hydrolysing)
MCGIAGVFAYGAGAPPVEEAPLLAVRERMLTRGPDGAGSWISRDRRIGLAHRRLAVIDLSDAGLQPMHDPASGNVIVLNGEIYNYRALRSELEAAGHRFVSSSDTEVLLKLYLAHGPGLLARIRGMYALAIFDAGQRRLFLARDPFGIKPLYISDDGRTLRFASQVKALRAGGGVDDRPDPAGHVGFFLWGHLPEPFTLYRGIRVLPAGTSLVVEATGARRESRHFDIAERTDALKPLSDVRSRADAQEALAAALRDSVRHHLVADVPVGVFLSSGLDSCTLLALAREADAGRIATFTLGFAEYEGTEQDEVPLAEAAARLYRSDQTSRRISSEVFRRHVDHLLESMDQPSIDGVNTYFVCQAAREAGLKVALSGVGGDELFAGYGEFTAIPQLVRLAAVPSRVPALGAAFRRVSAPVLGRFTSPKYAGLLEYGGDYAGAYLLRRSLFMPWELDQVLDPELARAGWSELRTLPAIGSSLPKASNGRLKVGALTSAWYMRNQLLRDADWASMAHSIELRTPLVDIALWETVIRLVRGGHPVGKQDMARSPVLALPPAILGRRKTGFSIPVREWLCSSASGHGSAMSRGLRGWALALYRHAGFADLLAA